MAAQKRLKPEVKEVVDVVKANDLDVRPGGTHLKVVWTKKSGGNKAGQAVIDPDNGKPIIISTSPSEHRFRELQIARLKRAVPGFKDPKKQHHESGAGGRSKFRDPEVQAKKREGIAREANRRADRTKKVRERIEPIVARVGGWDKKGFTSELGRVFFSYATTHKRVEAPKSEIAAIQNARQLRLGNTLSDHNATCWELLLDDLEKASRNGALIDRWTDLVRISRGLPGHNGGSQPAPGETKPEETAPAAVEQSVNGHRPERAIDLFAGRPTLALRAVAQMTMDRELIGDADLKEILHLGEEIQELEMQKLYEARQG